MRICTTSLFLAIKIEGVKKKECDIIMKGGITSGVVYPSTVVELAKTYRFRSIGGTSAGAIAASVTAAAEYGRREGTGGFAALEALPTWLGEKALNGQRNLFNLFVPDGETRPLFDVLTAPMWRKGLARWSMLLTAIERAPWLTAAGVFPGVLLMVLALVDGTSFFTLLSFISGLSLSATGGLAALLYHFYRLADKTLPETFLGLTTGHGSSNAVEAPALTDWLADLIDRCAGIEKREKPLTFGDLWGDDHEERDIDLQMMTTNVTLGRPYRLPLETKRFFFDRDEFKHLFPDKVYNWLVACGEAQLDEHKDQQYLHLPEPKDLPVVVAARMSLSFPILIGAIPLYAIDYTRVKKEDRIMRRCWFTDGGITSNFPVHFFDRPLPRRPTFTINLRPHHPDHGPDSDSFTQTQGVWMPNKNQDGILEVWNRFDEKEGLGKVGGFLKAVVDTGFSWRDALQLGVPGYRDRVVHISLSADEGGLNLNMPYEIIETLRERGAHAGALLTERFSDSPPADIELTWDNHRWVRYRSTMAALEQLLQNFYEGYTHTEKGQRSYEELLTRDPDEPPLSYRWKTRSKKGQPIKAQQAYAEEITRLLLELADELEQSEQNLQARSPRPRPTLRIVPDV